MNSNLAEKERIVRFIDLNKIRPGNWQYIDVDKFERDIREDETQKWVNIRRRERARARAMKKARRDVMMANLAFKVVGALLIFLGYSATLWTHEGGPVIAMGFAGIVLILLPDVNKDNAIKTLYKEYFEDERNDL